MKIVQSIFKFISEKTNENEKIGRVNQKGNLEWRGGGEIIRYKKGMVST